MTPHSPALLAELRGLLMQRRARFAAEARSHREHLGEADPAAGNTFIAGTEGAVADADDELDLALAAHAGHEWEAVRAALLRMDQGSYGLCTRCGKPISEPRLRALPEAAQCVACQSEDERRHPPR
jgi:DnaK suppressor protein